MGRASSSVLADHFEDFPPVGHHWRAHPDRSWGVGFTEPIDPNNLSNNVEYGTVNNILFGNQWVSLTGNGTDCNQNGSPDDRDILSGSIDTDADGVPTSALNDCNDNGTLDGFDIADGLSQDCRRCRTGRVPTVLQRLRRQRSSTIAKLSAKIVTPMESLVPDIASGYNTDGPILVPDECEDCNGNGILDSKTSALDSAKTATKTEPLMNAN